MIRLIDKKRFDQRGLVRNGSVRKHGCLGHLVHVFLALECAALVIESVHNLGGELVAHGLAATFAGVVDEVFHRNRLFAVGADFCGHLEGGAADTAGFYLHLGSNVLEGFLPDFESGLLLVCIFDFTVSSAE